MILTRSELSPVDTPDQFTYRVRIINLILPAGLTDFDYG